jgi:ATP/maltotriose-dependent transcriptional regulator MalT
VTASTTKPRVRADRRIIERPRLIKLLDESEAPITLLLAPAGYGKTTLARQWSKTLAGVIWISLSAGHRDVARFAESVADGVDALGGAAGGFVRAYLRAQTNPLRLGCDLATALAERLNAARVQWLVLDDCHETDGVQEISEMLDVLQRQAHFRILATARTRPDWATARRSLYGEVFEITREHLAMDNAETSLVLGRQPDLMTLVARAEGWPAVVGLVAAGHATTTPPSDVMPRALYGYLADEIFRSAPAAVQTRLMELALLPELSDESNSAGATVEEIRELGFLSSEHATELHPLIREFLLEKMAGTRNAEGAARRAVASCLERERWDRAFELILRFELIDLVEPALEVAYWPLLRSGHLGTLLAFASKVRTVGAFPPPAADLVEAEVALRDGSFLLASDLATRVGTEFAEGHRLASRAHAIVAQARFARGELAPAVEAYERAHAAAVQEDDEAHVLYGWAMAAIQGEIGDASWPMAELERRRHRSPLDHLRYGVAALTRLRYGQGLPDQLALDELLHSLPLVEDPRLRSSFTYTAAYALAMKCEYQEALRLAELSANDVDEFDLDFARPFTNWNLALINLGLRRFGATERYLQLIEDAIAERPLGFHVLNAGILRMRLALQTGKFDDAVALSHVPDSESAIPSMHAEYLATQGLCLAMTSAPDAAESAARTAETMSTVAEARVTIAAVRAVTEATRGSDGRLRLLFELAGRLGVWDPVVAALRSSVELRELAASTVEIRSRLEWLYQRSSDLSFARKAGFRTRSSQSPTELLSPREMEVLQLLARGFKNRDVARALVISESTTKVHVRHILEKLGVRTRVEAVSRLRLFDY